jgi:hypothetical protein
MHLKLIILLTKENSIKHKKLAFISALKGNFSGERWYEYKNLILVRNSTFNLFLEFKQETEVNMMNKDPKNIMTFIFNQSFHFRPEKSHFLDVQNLN